MDPTPTKYHFIVTLLLMIATMMTTTLRLGDNTVPLNDNPVLPGACSATTATTMLRSGDDATLCNVAMPHGALSVRTRPRSGDNTPLLGDNPMPFNNDPTPFGNVPTLLGACSATVVVMTLRLGHGFFQ